MMPPPASPTAPASSPMAQGGGKKNMPAPQDFQGANAEQTKANRPDQTNAFGTSTHWTQNPDGTYSQTSTFGGGLGQANEQLQNQAAASTAQPLDFSGLPQVQYGQDAFKTASDAAYNQETSRLDPMWNQREEAERSRLANQGLDPSSEAFQKAMSDFGRGRNDAYQGAINNSIGLGQSAANQMFGQSMAAHNQGLLEMMKQRETPLQELGQLGQFTGQSGFNSDQGLQAAGMQGAQDWQRYIQEMQQQADIGGGIGGLIGTLGKIIPILSDERAKTNIRRLPVEAHPGVPLALYEYREHPGETCLGVIAQDLAKVLPEFVHVRTDGMLMVDYRFLEVAHG